MRSVSSRVMAVWLVENRDRIIEEQKRILFELWNEEMEPMVAQRRRRLATIATDGLIARLQTNTSQVGVIEDSVRQLLQTESSLQRVVTVLDALKVVVINFAREEFGVLSEHLEYLNQKTDYFCQVVKANVAAATVQKESEQFNSQRHFQWVVATA
jgi:hypothetical protein